MPARRDFRAPWVEKGHEHASRRRAVHRGATTTREAATVRLPSDDAVQAEMVALGAPDRTVGGPDMRRCASERRGGNDSNGKGEQHASKLTQAPYGR